MLRRIDMRLIRMWDWLYTKPSLAKKAHWVLFCTGPTLLATTIGYWFGNMWEAAAIGFVLVNIWYWIANNVML